MQEKDDRIGKKTIKDRWGEIDVTPLSPLLRVNNFRLILHMSKILFYIYTIDKK